MQIFDIIYIGAGPATMFSLLNLINNKYKGKIIVIEKGKSLKDRLPNEVISGSFGAGCFSDSKISKGLDVGGEVELNQEELDKYSDLILNYISTFNNSLIEWETTKPFNTYPSNLKWDTLSVAHIGTERGRIIYKNIEDYLSKFPNIEFHFEEEVTDIINLSYNDYQVVAKKDNKTSVFLAKKVVIATGQKSTLPEYIINKFNIKSTPRALQLGIRVEDQLNEQYKNILNLNYDFKFISNYNINGLNLRIRTFCCNSGNAHTCAENVKEGFTCFNGHAYKEPNPINNSVNYGIICEVKGYNDLKSKENQINLMKKVNSLPTWEEDNFTNNIVKPKRKLLDGFPQLEGIYPYEILKAISLFVEDLSKIIDLSNAYYLYPEIKLSGYSPYLKEGYETEMPNLHMIGDCALSRGILKASIMGIKFSEYILKGEIKNDCRK